MTEKPNPLATTNTFPGFQTRIFETPSHHVVVTGTSSVLWPNFVYVAVNKTPNPDGSLSVVSSGGSHGNTIDEAEYNLRRQFSGQRP